MNAPSAAEHAVVADGARVGVRLRSPRPRRTRQRTPARASVRVAGLRAAASSRAGGPMVAPSQSTRAVSRGPSTSMLWKPKSPWSRLTRRRGDHVADVVEQPAACEPTARRTAAPSARRSAPAMASTVADDRRLGHDGRLRRRGGVSASRSRGSAWRRGEARRRAGGRSRPDAPAATRDRESAHRPCARAPAPSPGTCRRRGRGLPPRRRTAAARARRRTRTPPRCTANSSAARVCEHAHRPVLAQDHLGGQLVGTGERQRGWSPSTGRRERPTTRLDYDPGRVREAPAEVRGDLVGRDRALGGGRRPSPSGRSASAAAAQLVGALEEVGARPRPTAPRARVRPASALPAAAATAPRLPNAARRTAAG